MPVKESDLLSNRCNRVLGELISPKQDPGLLLGTQDLSEISATKHEVKSSDLLSSNEAILITSKNGIKLEKIGGKYVITDPKGKQVESYSSITWATKKHEHMANIFSRRYA